MSDRQPVSPLQLVLLLWIVGITLYLMVQWVDLRYYVLIQPAARTVVDSLSNSRVDAAIKNSEASGNKITRVALHFRPRGGPYTKVAVEDRVVSLGSGIYLVDVVGVLPPDGDLEIDQHGELYLGSRPLQELRLLVAGDSTPSVCEIRFRSGKAPRID